ncbi:FGGY family carbohydrate kinase [Nitrosomonas oligotropha]|uniref:FGGY family carbohydrate kinase n=1 Tax=Nitrosomonas oligotropha TaxID=42354 RepID=UPI00136F4F70|nr:FGGY family carbohydrate kinase [Nitrosomonas oligotropha]MXS82812.1 carbohydrate kinase [Nitrosomonas oligotropha]
MDRTLISAAAVALDLGSTSIKAALLDRQGNLQHIVTQPAPVIDSRDGRYESSASDYARIAAQVLQDCIAQANNKPPLGLCSQRSSFLLWDKASGEPVTPLISWQDDRGKSCCEHLHASEETLHSLTGLRLTPYYFAPKLSVLLQENPPWREKLVQGEWLAGTLDTFLIWRWTNGAHFVTDASMAARTLLMDIHRQQWSDTLCHLFDIPRSILPHLKPSTGLNLPLNTGVTLQASVGDQSAALIASLTDRSSEALVNLGTGGFVIRSLAAETSAFGGYLHTLVYQDNQRETQFAVEGTLNSIAAALAPYPVKDCNVEDLAQSDIFCLAEPSGLGAPYFRNDWGIHFSQSVSGLTARQIGALLLEAIIFRVARIVEDFHRHSPLTRIYLSGGLSELLCLRHSIAQCAPCPVSHLQQKEASLLGAALLASEHKIKRHRNAEDIAVLNGNNALVQKYRHWKVWFDALLKTPNH